MNCIGTLLSDRKSYRYPNSFIFKWDTTENNGEIVTPQSDIIYRGVINLDDDNFDSAYINLIEFGTNSVRKIMLKHMEILPDNNINVEDNVVTVFSLPMNTLVQIVETPPFFENEFDTNRIKFEKIHTTTEPFSITIPKSEYPTDYVIWIETKCKKIQIG